MVQVNITDKKGLVQESGNDGVDVKSKVRMRSGVTAAGSPSCMIGYQTPETGIGTGNQDITIAMIKKGVLYDDPEGNANWTLPDAADVVSGLAGYEVGDCLDFSVINQATTTVDEKITLVMGTGGTAAGLMVIDSQLVSGIRGSGSGMFRLRVDSATGYTVYRLA